jgi:hypothetical protein
MRKDLLAVDSLSVIQETHIFVGPEAFISEVYFSILPTCHINQFRSVYSQLDGKII